MLACRRMERLLPDVERSRRAAGWVIFLFGLVQAGALTWAMLAFRQAQPATLVFVALALGLLAWGLRLALRREVVIEVDRERIASIVEVRLASSIGFGTPFGNVPSGAWFSFTNSNGRCGSS